MVPSTGAKALREQHIEAMFKTESDSRNRYVILVSCGYQVIPTNYQSASCPRCNSGKVVAMAVIKRGWAGYFFSVCRKCAWAHQDYASEGDMSLPTEDSPPDEQASRELEEF